MGRSKRMLYTLRGAPRLSTTLVDPSGRRVVTAGRRLPASRDRPARSPALPVRAHMFAASFDPAGLRSWPSGSTGSSAQPGCAGIPGLSPSGASRRQGASSPRPSGGAPGSRLGEPRLAARRNQSADRAHAASMKACSRWASVTPRALGDDQAAPRSYPSRPSWR
jgi:hypothetical protein